MEIDDRVSLDRLVETFNQLDSHLAGGGVLPRQWAHATPPLGRPPLEEDGAVLEDVIHGTRRGYNQGCHCGRCRKANRMRRNLSPDELERTNV